MKTLLFMLPYIGLGISALATIWGLTQELYTKDENNKRHLTKAGKYSIAYTLLGLLISFNTSALKTITDSQDRDEARTKAAQKDQQDALKELARKQQEEADRRERQEAERKQTEQTAEVAQGQRDNALAAQQRDLSLQQQQLTGFNEAELRARQRTLAELKKSNKILFNINRGQYPIGDSMKVRLNYRVSIDQPRLRKYSEQIQNTAQQMIEMVEQRKRTNPPQAGESWLNWGLNQHFPSGIGVNSDGEVSDQISILEPDSPLLPKHDFPAEELVENIHLSISIFGKDEEVNTHSAPELSFEYWATGFNNEPHTSGLTYSKSARAYRVLGPPLKMEVTSKGRLVSYLDLPGASLLITCRPVQGEQLISNCEGINIEFIEITTPFGFPLMIKENSLEHKKINNQDFIFHRFAPNIDSFFDRYMFHYP